MEIIQGDELDVDGLTICRGARWIGAAGTASDDEWQQKTENFFGCYGLSGLKIDVCGAQRISV